MTRDGIRAIALAAIMVLSMVAVGAGFAGSVAGQEADVVVTQDDTTAEAVDKIETAGEGETVQINNGVELDLSEAIDVDNASVVIRGEDADLTNGPLVRMDNLGTGDEGISVRAENVEIRDLRIEDDTSTGVTWNIRTRADGLVVDNVDIERTADTGLSGLGNPAINFLDVSEATVTDSNLTNGAVNVRLVAGGEATVEGNEFDMPDGYPNALFVTGEGFDPLPDDVDVTLENNGGLSYAEQTENGYVRGFTTISGALEAPQTGDPVAEDGTVLVEPGVYGVFDVATNNVTITALGAQDDTVVDIGSDERVNIAGSVDSTTISGFTFDFEGQAIYDGGASEGTQILDNRFELADGTESAGYGVRFEGGTSDSVARSNEFIGINTSAEEEFGNGVVVSGPDGHVIAENTFSQNSIGVNVGGKQPAGALSVENNTFTDQDDAAIVLNHDTSSKPQINVVDNRIEANEIGVAALKGGSIDVTGNEFVDNNQSAIDARALTESTVNATSNWWGSSAGPNDDSNTYNVDDQGDAVKGPVTVSPWLDSETDGKAFTPVSVGNESFASIQAGVGTGPDSTVELTAGTYDEEVSVDVPNVTITGQGDETVVNGSIALDATDAHLSDVRIESDVGDVFPNPAASNNAINVAGSDVTVSDVTVDLSVESAEFSEGLAIEVFGSDASATITNATIDGTGEMTADGLTAVVGVSADNGAAATVRDSDIDVASDGYSFAVVAREGATTDVRYNELSASGGEFDGVGFGVEGDNPAAQTVRFNTFDGVDTIENKAGSGELDVTGNYWTNLTDVEFLTDADTFDESQKGGEITYDPFLTVEPDEVDAESLDETTQFGHDLVVPADGTPHSVAFPAPVEGNVSEVFGEFNGTVFAYDGDGWESGSEIADEDVGALDAFVVKVDEDESDLRIAFEYAASDAQYPTSTDLEEGWNFVGAPESGNSTDAFDVTTTNIQTVSHINAGAGSQPYGASSTAPFATNPDSVSPFQGYWVFVTDDGELGATVPVGPTQSNEEGALAGN